MSRQLSTLLALSALLACNCQSHALAEQPTELQWPTITKENRPGVYWWWPGSAVTKQDLTWNLETYRKAGWGNMGVIGIYGVKGEEARSIDIFSPKWFEMYNHAVTEAKRLAGRIARQGPIAVARAKAAINQAQQTGLDAGLAFELEAVTLTFGTEDQEEGMTAFLERRRPEFKGQ